MSKKKRYEAGDYLCDMHYGFEHLPDNLEVVSHVKLYAECASEAIQALNHDRHPGNKCLVVIGDNARFPSDGTFFAAYAYDGRYFGMVELKYKEN